MTRFRFGLILESMEPLESRINKFLTIFDFQKHCFQILSIEKRSDEDDKRLERLSIVLISDRL